ncbi:MAG: hypothetical protein LBN93_02230 [Candidatus Symbiothrix sp.]|jgi:hypothetical protein|nr:hypothetical protein [Candidatus Symbiothrix sp.]
MRTSFLKQISFAAVVAGGLWLTSCMGEELDLDNLSEDIQLGGTFETPVLTETIFRIDSLLKHIDQSDSKATIGVNDAGIAALFFTDEPQVWSMTQINEDFSSFSADMANLAISDLFADNALITWMINTIGAGVIPTGTNVTHDFAFSLAGAFDVPTARKIDHIDLRKEQITLRIRSTDLDIKTDDLLKITLKFPQYNSAAQKTVTTFLNKGTGETTVVFDDPFNLDCTKDIITSLELIGDGQTTLRQSSKIDINITFAPQEYTAYGWFNLVIPGETKNVNVDADMQKYLAEGSNLIFADPKLNFTVASTVGTPLIMKLNLLEAQYKDGSTKTLENIAFNINPSTTTLLTLNKETFTKTADRTTFMNMFTTNLTGLTVDYSLETPHIDDIEHPGVDMQNISSTAELSLQEDVELPFSLNTGSLILYNDTIDADLTTDLKPEDVNATVTLYLDYVNELPVDADIKIYRLDENEQIIPGSTPWSVKLPAGGKGIADTAPLEVKDYLNVRYLLVEYSSGTLKAPVDLRGDDYIQLKVRAKVNGKVNIKNL